MGLGFEISKMLGELRIDDGRVWVREWCCMKNRNAGKDLGQGEKLVLLIDSQADASSFELAAQQLRKARPHTPAALRTPNRTLKLELFRPRHC